MSLTTLQRLLRYPHAAVFDKDPVADLAFRLRHPAGASWTVAERVMTVYAANVEAATYDLAALTVQDLVLALQADGFEVIAVNPAVSGLSALVLVEGSGDEGQSNGDRVFAFTSLLWVLLTTYSAELGEAREQIVQALRQMVITQAEGEWLDVWGTLYGDSRVPGETDAHYADRIPKEAFRLRVNAYGIEKAIADLTGFDVRIEEPWRDIFRLDESVLSGPHRFYDGDRIGYHLIQPVARTQVDWPEVMKIIERNRPAGVIVLEPMVWRGSEVDASSDHNVEFGGASLHARLQSYEDRALLDFSAIEETSILNHESRRRREILRSTYVAVPSQTWGGGFTWADGDTWATQYVVLGEHTRDYRVYYGSVEYGQTWTGARTWASISSTWADAGPIVDSGYSRS